ncbi:MAG: cytochrome c oxidase subunit II [Bacteroidia bacterium]
MDILTLIKVLVPIVIVLAAFNVYLFFRLKDIDLFAKWDANKINGIIFVLFFIIGIPLSIWSTGMYDNLYGLIHDPASSQGEAIDEMFWITAWITGIVFVVTHAALFYFCYKYAGKDGKKAYFYPENNKLEIWWTVIPAIVLTLLIFKGIFVWTDITTPAPAGATQLELTGKQFEWTVRYPGIDGKFGAVSWDSINNANGNSNGYHFSDKNSQDDVNPQEIHIPVGKPVKVIIKAKDVLHSASFPHFRLKMDAVPGMATSIWFTPTKTTKEMREIKNNPKFNYELACQEICGGGHWNMRRVVVVETEEEYKKWLKAEKPTYLAWKEANTPAAPVVEAKPATADSTKTAPTTPATPTPAAPKKAEPAKVEVKKAQAAISSKANSNS